MKKIILTSLIFLLFISSYVYAEISPVSYDFEDYLTEHASPAGWTSSNLWELSPAKVDNAHGTSLKVEYLGLPIYTFSETISAGKFLISFEAYFEDFNQRFRLHLSSPSSGSDAHSILYFANGKIQSGNSQKDAWSFSDISEYETKKWYQIDLLFDMDQKQLSYYIDGAEVAVTKINFVNFNKITFRTESGSKGAVLYMDNVSFKFVSPGSFDTAFGRNTAPSQGDIIELAFSDLIDKNSLGGIKVYNMGDNPVSYSAAEVSYKLIETGAKKAVLKLDRPFGKSMIYKVYAPEIKTLFGDEFSNDTVYFSSGGALAENMIVNADFSTIPSFTLPLQPVNPASDKAWTKGNNVMVYPVYTTDLNEAQTKTAVVRFAPNKGSKNYPDNSTKLSRTLDNSYIGQVIIEYKMKVIAGNQYFRLIDSEQNSLELINIKDCELYNSENKIADISDWFTIRISADFDAKTAVILKDDEIIAENVDISALQNLAAVEFEQKNIADSYNDPEVPLADSYLAYFTLGTMREGVSVSMVTFEDNKGNIFYPENDIPSTAYKMHIRFSDEVLQNSLRNGISLTIDGISENFIGSYDNMANEYVLTFPEYLAGDSEYLLEILDSVKDSAGNKIATASGSFKTQQGVVSANNLLVEEDGENVIVSSQIIHTDKSCPELYLIFSAYKGNLMIDFRFEKIKPAEDERNVSVAKSYIRPAEADLVSGFLWDGFDTMVPLIRMQSAE